MEQERRGKSAKDVGVTVPALESWEAPGGLSEAPPPGPQRSLTDPSPGPHSCIWAPKYNCEARI